MTKILSGKIDSVILGIGCCFILLTTLFYKEGMEQVVGLLFGVMILVLSYIDLRTLRVPNPIVLIGGGGIFVVRLLLPSEQEWYSYLIGGLLGGILFFLLILLSSGGFGGGDLKLFAVCGLMIGWKMIVIAFLLMAITGAVWAIGFILIKGRKNGAIIPYVPVIALSVWLVYLGIPS